MTSFRIPEIDIDALFRTMRRKLWQCLLPGVAGMLFLFFFSTKILPPDYTTATRIFVVNRSDPYFTSFLDLRSSGMVARDLGAMLVNERVTGAVISQMGLELTPEKLAEKIDVVRIRDTSILEISVTDKNISTAVEIANRIREEVIAEGVSVTGIDAVHTIYTADETHYRKTPNAKRVLVMSLLSGMLISIAVTIVYYGKEEEERGV